MVSLREAKIPRGVRENIKGVKDLKSNNFFKLPETVQVDILNDGIAKFRTYIETRKLTPELSDYMKLFEDIYRETGDPNVTPYLQLFDAMKSRNGSKLSRDVFETLRNDDPDTFAVYSRYPGEEVANIPGFNFHEYKRTGNGVIEPAEPTTGALTSNPINNASSAEAAPGALTNPSLEVPKKETIIREPIDDIELVEAAALGPDAYTRNRIGSTKLNETDIPVFLTKKGGSLPKEGVVVGPDTSKPGVDTPLAEENSAASPEAVAAEAAKGTTEKPEVKTTSETPETPKKGALTGEGEKTPLEPSKGIFGKTWDYLRNHKGKTLGWGLGIPVGLGLAGAAIYDLASDDSTLKSLFKGDYPTEIPNISSASQPRVKSLDQREGAYMPERLLRFTTNEEYTPGKIPSHIPQDNLPSIKESTASKKVKSQPQVINAPAPENNATADYVRAAYNSYIPSDAGRAYQKAIYGDPLELERNRFQQQQQQKWRDFVMRSGQSPAELVQRGLMPYDALQYV